MGGAIAQGPAAMPRPFLCAGSLGRFDIHYSQDEVTKVTNDQVLRSNPNVSQRSPAEAGAEPVPSSAPVAAEEMDYAPEVEAYVRRRQGQGSRYYWLTRMLKKTIFGELHHGLVLLPGDAEHSHYVMKEPVEEVAVKIYFRDRLRDLVNRTSENPTQELAAMQCLPPHPHVMTLEDCCYDANYVYGIMEFYDGGEMYDMISPEPDAVKPLSEVAARSYFKALLEGMKHFHDFGLAHRDMSLENIMVRNSKDSGSSSSKNCKIIDFGMCQLVPKDALGRYMRVVPRVPCGKKHYMSPEVLENATPFNPMGSDVWAMGVLLFILLTGYPPVEVASKADSRFVMICHLNRLGELLTMWGYGHLSVEVQDLLCRMLRPQPIDRISLEEVARHPWMMSSS